MGLSLGEVVGAEDVVVVVMSARLALEGAGFLLGLGAGDLRSGEEVESSVSESGSGGGVEDGRCGAGTRSGSFSSSWSFSSASRTFSFRSLLFLFVFDLHNPDPRISTLLFPLLSNSLGLTAAPVVGYETLPVFWYPISATFILAAFSDVSVESTSESELGAGVALAWAESDSAKEVSGMTLFVESAGGVTCTTSVTVVSLSPSPTVADDVA